RGRLVRAAQAVVGLLARRVAVALQRHARARGQLPQRLAELQVVALHDEGKGVAARAAAEALPGLSLGEDVEGGRLLAVERAERAVAAPGLPQRDGTADEIDQIDAGLDFLDGRRRHAVTPGSPSPSAAGCLPSALPGWSATSRRRGFAPLSRKVCGLYSTREGQRKARVPP